MTTLSVECLFKGMRADHMPTAANYAAYRRRHASRLPEGFLVFHWPSFILSRESNQGWASEH